MAGALGDLHDLVCHERWSAWHPVPECDLLVIQPSSSIGLPTPDTLGHILERHPHIPILPVAARPDSSLVLALGGLGVTRILEWPDSGGLDAWKRTVFGHVAAALGDTVRRCAAHLDPLVAEALAWATTNAHLDVGLEDLEDAVGCTSRTLQRRCAAVHGMTPGRAMTLGRVAQASFQLKTTRQSVERVADRVGFADGAGLRRALARSIGMVPTELRDRSGFRAVLGIVAALPANRLNVH